VEEVVPAKKLTICYHTASGYCPSCRKRQESRAAEQPPAADLPHGQLGLNALALAALLRVFYRLPLRQISQLFAHLTELSISPGGLSKQIQRLGRWLAEDQKQIQRALRLSAVVNADETIWRTNGHNDYLWTLTNDRYTLYHVDRSRGGQVIRRLLGKGFGRQGQTLISDFYGVYDQFDGPQQKCLAHLLRELHETVARRPELQRQEFFRGCKQLLQAMLKLKAQQEHAPPQAYLAQVKRLEDRLQRLGQKAWNDADADRLAARLRKYHGKLTTFLHDPAVEPTNNAGERAIRPAVVMRKITGGSRSPRGAKAWAILASVIRTAFQQQRDLLETLKTLIRAHWSGQSLPLLTTNP
jgi:transposase